MPGSIRSMHVEHVFRDVQTDCGSLLHGRLLRWQFDTATLAHRCRRGASTPSPQKQRQSQPPEDRYLRIKFASEAGGVLVTAEEVTHQTTKRAGNPRRDWPLEPEWLCRRVEHDNNSDDDKGSKTKGVEDLDQLCSKTPLRADRRLKGLGQTAPSLRSPSTSAAFKPSHSPKTSAVCSPSSGAGLTGAGAPSKRTAKAGMRSVPFACCIVWIMPRFSKLGSPSRSPVSSTAPAGTPAPPIRRIASCLSCRCVQSVIIWSISDSCWPRASRVAKRGSSIRSSRSMTLSSRRQCSGLAWLVKT